MTSVDAITTALQGAGYFADRRLATAVYLALKLQRPLLLEGEPGDLRFYRFVGRLKQIIIRGGVKIAPEELDTVLSQMPGVLEGAVTGYRDELMGERICAVVVPRPGTTPTLESVRAHFAAAGLAVFKCPEKLLVIEQLPRNSVGKVVRPELAKLAEATPAAG